MRESVRLLFVGDISLGGDFAARVARGSSGWTDPFEEVRQIFRDVDLTLGNLEGPLHLGTAAGKKRNTLGAPGEAVDALSFLGLSALSLGNNHITDQGAEGINRTREILESRGITPFGAGPDLAAASKPAFAEARGQSFAFLAYSEQGADVGTRVATDSTEGCVPFELDRVEQDIRVARKSADHVVISLHWGFQYDHYPSPEQIAAARRIIDMGAVIVFGHHPHVLQGIEQYNNGLILYSLGNFFFPNFIRTDGLKFRFPKESKTATVLLCEIGMSGVQSISTVALRTERNFRMRILNGRAAARKMRSISVLSGALDAQDYDSTWRLQHERTVKKRLQQEERLQIRSETLALLNQARDRGFIGSLKRVNGRRVLETVQRIGRLARLV